MRRLRPDNGVRQQMRMYDFAVQTRPPTPVPTPRASARLRRRNDLILSLKYSVLEIVFTLMHEVSMRRGRNVCSRLAAEAADGLVEVSLSLRTPHRAALRDLRLRTR
jgi:hypothetical protein